jgi:hypothetical protein
LVSKATLVLQVIIAVTWPKVIVVRVWWKKRQTDRHGRAHTVFFAYAKAYRTPESIQM